MRAFPTKPRRLSVPSIVILLFLCVICSPVQAKKIWGGIYAGKNSGLSVKKWESRWAAYDYAAGWSTENKTIFHTKVDYLVHIYKLFDQPQGRLPLYYGIGGEIEFGENVESGIRAPIGLNYIFPRLPIDIFIEVAPVLNIFPGTTVSLSGAIGGRFHFTYK